jgi:hypothetical protein
VNVQIVDGLGQTSWTNGTGNLIIGYAEPGMYLDRLGSHNLIVGDANQWSSHAFGGFVAGTGNLISGMNCSILGGNGNEAAGFASTVSGGVGNLALGQTACVAGGHGRTAYSIDDWAAGSLYEDF